MKLMSSYVSLAPEMTTTSPLEASLILNPLRFDVLESEASDLSFFRMAIYKRYPARASRIRMTPISMVKPEHFQSI